MRLVADASAAEWLEAFMNELEPGDFEWDKGNRTKNSKHGVMEAEVEELFLGPVGFAGRIVEPAHD